MEVVVILHSASMKDSSHLLLELQMNLFYDFLYLLLYNLLRLREWGLLVRRGNTAAEPC